MSPAQAVYKLLRRARHGRIWLPTGTGPPSLVEEIRSVGGEAPEGVSFPGLSLGLLGFKWRRWVGTRTTATP
jgi:hypothetical protein